MVLFVRVVIAALLCAIGVAHAQVPGCVVAGAQCVMLQAFTPIATAPLPVSVVSNAVAFPSLGPTLGLMVVNQGPSTAYLATGSASIVATIYGTPIAPGQSLYLPEGANTTIAAVTASGVASLALTSGTGAPLILSGPMSVITPPLAYIAPVTASVATSSGILFAAGTYLTAVLVCTLPSSTSNVWINPAGGTATASLGVRVPSAGGCATFGGSSSLPLPTVAPTAITDGASAQTVTLTGG